MTDLLKAIDLDALLRLAEATSRHGESLEKWKVRAQFTEAALKAVPVLVARLARSEERARQAALLASEIDYYLRDTDGLPLPIGYTRTDRPDDVQQVAHAKVAALRALLSASAPSQQAPQGETAGLSLSDCPRCGEFMGHGHECPPGAATPAGGGRTTFAATGDYYAPVCGKCGKPHSAHQRVVLDYCPPPAPSDGSTPEPAPESAAVQGSGSEDGERGRT